jgi:hypothetical protein
MINNKILKKAALQVIKDEKIMIARGQGTHAKLLRAESCINRLQILIEDMKFTDIKKTKHNELPTTFNKN